MINDYLSIPSQLNRLLDMMKKRDDVEVALMPRIAFEKLQLEIICWKNSATIAWLQNLSQSSFTIHEDSCRGEYLLLNLLWNKLLSGWKNKDKVIQQIGKWLSGIELNNKESDSAIVRNWDIIPKK